MRKYAADHEWLTIIQLPPYRPDLNPVEGIWSLLRRGPMANTAFTDPTTSPEPSAEDSPTSSAIPNSSTAASPKHAHRTAPHRVHALSEGRGRGLAGAFPRPRTGGAVVSAG